MVVACTAAVEDSVDYADSNPGRFAFKAMCKGGGSVSLRKCDSPVVTAIGVA